MVNDFPFQTKKCNMLSISARDRSSTSAYVTVSKIRMDDEFNITEAQVLNAIEALLC